MTPVIRPASIGCGAPVVGAAPGRGAPSPSARTAAATG